MSDTRKGIFTPEQEVILDKLYVAKGLVEQVDGVIIRTIDNVLIEKLKSKIPLEYLPTVYEIIDELIAGLETLIVKK